MGWGYRKSFGSGPFRVNLSKSGVSYSFGIKGARINTGSKGTYVSMGSHGIYYRKKIGDSIPNSQHAPYQPLPEAEYHGIHTITSADINQLTDSDSKDFIKELSEKSKQISYVTWLGIVPLFLFTILFLYFSFENRTIVTQPETNRIIAEVSNYGGLYVRSAPSIKSAIVKSANDGQRFTLIDSTNKKWLKIGFNDSTGFISKAFSVIKHEHSDVVAENQIVLINPQFYIELVVGAILFTILIYWLNKKDRPRFEMELYYELDEQLTEIYQKFSDFFSEFTRSAKIWQYVNANDNVDFKRNAGAGKLINRISVKSASGHKVPLRFFKTNVQIPNIKLRNTDLYFLPERLLIKRNNDFAAVFYKHLNISIQTTRFIESESVPGDAQVIDHTWQYLNKNGSPDRRFNNNRHLPICAYSEYTFTSSGGIYEVITTSKNGAFDKFAGFIHQVGLLQEKMGSLS